MPIFEQIQRYLQAFKLVVNVLCSHHFSPRLVETNQNPTRVDVSDKKRYRWCRNKVVGGIQVDLTIVKGQDAVGSCPNVQGGGNLEAEKD